MPVRWRPAEAEAFLALRPEPAALAEGVRREAAEREEVWKDNERAVLERHRQTRLWRQAA